jgi:ABC-type amino acid transport substrate-binding protein
VAHESPIQADSVADLAGKTYCLPNGYAESDTLAAMRRADQLTRTKPPSMAHCMQLLDIGRVDFVVANAHVGRAAMAKVFGNAMRTRFLNVVIARADLHVLFPRAQPGSEAARERFNEALAAIRQNGTYAEVVGRFVGVAE